MTIEQAEQLEFIYDNISDILNLSASGEIKFLEYGLFNIRLTAGQDTNTTISFKTTYNRPPKIIYTLNSTTSLVPVPGSILTEATITTSNFKLRTINKNTNNPMTFNVVWFALDASYWNELWSSLNNS